MGLLFTWPDSAPNRYRPEPNSRSHALNFKGGTVEIQSRVRNFLLIKFYVGNTIELT